MNRIKHIIKFAVFAVLAVVLYFTGAGKTLDLSHWSLDWSDVLKILLVIFAVLAVEHLILLLLSFIKTEIHRVRTVLTLCSNLVRYVTVLAIVICVLSLLKVDIATILAGLGVIALIIGFGAESLITDVVTSFFILVDNQYNVGDIIEVGGFRGTVSEIGIRTTSLTDAGGNIKIINNSDMKNILNRSDKSSKAVTDFSIPYESYLGVQALSSSSVDLRFVAEVGESDIYSGARILNHDLFVGFRSLGVECPFPQVDVHSK